MEIDQQPLILAVRRTGDLYGVVVAIEGTERAYAAGPQNLESYDQALQQLAAMLTPVEGELLETLSSVEYPELLTIRQAVAYAGVTRRTLYNWIAAGKVERVRTPGGCPRIVRVSLDCRPD